MKTVKYLFILFGILLNGCATAQKPFIQIKPCEIPQRELNVNKDLALYIVDLKQSLYICNARIEAYNEILKGE